MLNKRKYKKKKKNKKKFSSYVDLLRLKSIYYKNGSE